MTRIAGNSLWKMMFVFDWPKVKNEIELAIFKSTFGIEGFEAQNRVNEYVLTIPVNDRISRELKLKKEKAVIEPSMAPLINSHSGIGRNSPCPCGSGKKYKKCCSSGR